VQDPAQWLRSIGQVVPAFDDPGRSAVLDADHLAMVNHEVYLFAETDARDRFRRDPLPACGTLTDPVTLVRFRPDASSPHLEWNGRPYWFASDSTRAAFGTMPDMYANPRPDSMTPRTGTAAAP
jgi:YHS domain-containing protein